LEETKKRARKEKKRERTKKKIVTLALGSIDKASLK
jgi:hypothetical protein